MIINISRSQMFQTCRRKAYFYDQGLVQLGMAFPLSTGSAYHKGCAVLTATKDANKALEAAQDQYVLDIAKAKLLPEEIELAAREMDNVKRMLTAQAKQYVRDTWTVLKPEVEGLVAIPGTEHHCWYCHQLIHPNEPFDVCPALNDYKYYEPADRELARSKPSCIQPHYLKFRTDAVLSWNSLIWILERKTSGMKQEIFWDQWYLSHQLSGYMYGVRKATGLPVHGVLLEKMPKPARNQRPETFDFTPEREPYLRTDSELAEFEAEISAIASDYESAAIRGRTAFYRNPQACCDYNRRCDYWMCCKRGGIPAEGEFRQRDRDYVELEYYKLLGLEPPNVPTSA